MKCARLVGGHARLLKVARGPPKSRVSRARSRLLSVTRKVDFLGRPRDFRGAVRSRRKLRTPHLKVGSLPGRVGGLQKSGTALHPLPTTSRVLRVRARYLHATFESRRRPSHKSNFKSARGIWGSRTDISKVARSTQKSSFLKTCAGLFAWRCAIFGSRARFPTVANGPP